MTSHSAAMTTETHEALVAHLDRRDYQEGQSLLALYRPSSGASRTTAIVHELVLPQNGERKVHGNVAFTGDYFLRAAFAAADADAGLVLLHSHPGGYAWQGMSSDDIHAERGHAAQAQAITGLPLVGMTMGTGEESWSARIWQKNASGEFARQGCESVRVVGDQLRVTYNPELRPKLPTTRRAATHGFCVGRACPSRSRPPAGWDHRCRQCRFDGRRGARSHRHPAFGVARLRQGQDPQPRSPAACQRARRRSGPIEGPASTTVFTPVGSSPAPTTPASP